MTDKVYPTLIQVISADSNESESKLGKILSIIEQVSSEDSELTIFEKMALLSNAFQEINEQNGELEIVMNENEEFANALEEARKKMSGDAVHEEDYFFSRHLIDNNSSKIHTLKSIQAAVEDIDVVTTLIKEWGENSSKLMSILNDFIEYHKGLTVINHNIKGLKEDIANTEIEEEYSEDKFEGMFKITGKQFKNILRNSVVDSISGYILNVTDRTLQVKACQPIELNNLNKIRPPVSVIGDETIIYIDEISFYNENTGRSFDESDLETIVAFM